MCSAGAGVVPLSGKPARERRRHGRPLHQDMEHPHWCHAALRRHQVPGTPASLSSPGSRLEVGLLQKSASDCMVSACCDATPVISLTRCWVPVPAGVCTGLEQAREGAAVQPRLQPEPAVPLALPFHDQGAGHTPRHYPSPRLFCEQIIAWQLHDMRVSQLLIWLACRSGR